MLNFFRRRKIKKYASYASAYVQEVYIPPIQTSGIRYSLSGTEDILFPKDKEDSGIKYSIRDTAEPPKPKVPNGIQKKPADPYDAAEVTQMLRSYSSAGNFNEMLQGLEKHVNQTFVDRLLYYINDRGVRDSDVYKAAQVDKRLFSKIVSNQQYKPSKDTAIALSFALQLSLDEANDLLSRAGYTFSHSNKRDIIIEYFFREKVYNLMDINDVLYQLNQKLIGRL